MTRSAPLTVLSSVSSDAHTWNLVYLQLLLEERGHRVSNLGACVPDDELVHACLRQSPDLLVVSSVNRHGLHDAHRVVRAVRAEPDLVDLPAVLGGKLGVDGPLSDAESARLVDAGFTRVFTGPDPVAALTAFLPGVEPGAPRRPAPTTLAA